MAESFDAVLAAIRRNGFAGRVELNSLQAAHEAEVAERDRAVRQANSQTEHFERRYYLESDRADRAVGLLRRATMRTSDDELKAQVTAFLSEQAGERENGNG